MNAAQTTEIPLTAGTFPQIAERIGRIYHPAGQPVWVHGSPGIGKSQLGLYLAEYLETLTGNPHGFIDIRAQQMSEVDGRGVPFPSEVDKKTYWYHPAFWPDEQRDGKYGILLLDELPSAPLAVQASLYQLILDGRLGEYVLPKGWYIVAAGNLPTDRAVVHRISSALSRRFAHAHLLVVVDPWCKWAISKGGRFGPFEPETVAYIRFRGERLHDFQPDQLQDANPRSWEFVDNCLKMNKAAATNGGAVEGAEELATYAGVIGEPDAIEFTAWLQMYRSLPNIDGILLNPGAAKVPDPAQEANVAYAIVTELSRRVNQQNFHNAMEYVGKIGGDFEAVFVKDAAVRCPDIQNTPEFITWAADNTDVYL